MDSEPSHSYLYRISSFISKSSISSLVILLAFTTNILILSSHDAVAATKESSDIEERAPKEQDKEEEDISEEVDPTIEKELLWFARAIYSETKVPSEQELVAWVIRNRVESYQYPDTYTEVILQPNQFSGFRTADRHYHTNVSLVEGDMMPGWESAQRIAKEVYYADASERPISPNVWHFYSPVSASYTPSWALGVEPTHVIEDIATGTVRFAFYANVQ